MLARVTARHRGQDDTPTLDWPTTPAPARPPVARAADPLVVVAEAALDAQAEYEQARRLAEVRVLLAEQAARDGAHLSGAELDRRGADACSKERRGGFAVELVARVVPDRETLRIAAELDRHALALWREVATSLVDEFPPSFAHLRGAVDQERRAEQRTSAGLLRAEAELAARRRTRGWLAWLWSRSTLAALAAEQASLATLRQASQDRLARLDATLAAITQREADRAGWFADTGDILARGVAAMHVLDTPSPHHASSHEGGPARPAPGGQGWPQVGS